MKDGLALSGESEEGFLDRDTGADRAWHSSAEAALI